MKYKGKTLVITGAAGEIGSAICKHFAKEKLRFYLLDLGSQLTKCEELAGELLDIGAQHAESLEMDVTNPEQINSIIKKIGEKEKYIDILINNAGFGNETSITNGGTIENFRKMMAVNVEGPWMITQAALPYIGRPVKKPPKKNRNQREGQLIYIESSAGIVGVPHMASYVATKHALIGIADVVRQEFKLKNEKIRVISI
ncbi:MAG: SDR family NAD(P)-dependent oxidoreductase, partial [Promethearchaeota archaeon]